MALLVPEGASTLLALHPNELLVSTSSQRVVNALASTTALDTFATRTGVDPRRVMEAVFAEYEDGTLILARGPFDARLVVEEAGSRMATVESAANEPLARRAGFIGNDRVELIALDSDVLLIGQGLVSEVGVLASCVNQPHPDRCIPALGTGPPRILWEDHKSSHCVLYVPGQLALPPGYGTSMLLSGVQAMAVIATPLGSDALVIDIDMRGTFPEAADENFRTLLTNVGMSELGTALGIDVAAERLAIERTTQRMQLHSSLPVTTLITGLRALFTAEIRELLAPPERSPVSP